METITVKKRKEESQHGINYYEVTGAKWFNRCATPSGRNLRKGDLFNVYRREYETDQQGNITRWLCDTKHGCIYDGKSLSSSLQACDNELTEYYTTGLGKYENAQPLN